MQALEKKRKFFKGHSGQKFLLCFSHKFLTDLKTNFTKCELSATFPTQDNTVYISPYKTFTILEILPGLPTTNKISKCYCQTRSPRGHILKSLASKVKSLALKPQVLENCPVLGWRTAVFFEWLKFC